ncbi:hypothetical protein HYQ46_004756 [Verticillium longisporum]|nr:hypothetical protein HYQ46_004756 [Verticillium longisporum]
MTFYALFSASQFPVQTRESHIAGGNVLYVLRNSAQKWPSYAYLPEDASPSPVELLVVCSDIDYESRDLLRAAA